MGGEFVTRKPDLADYAMTLHSYRAQLDAAVVAPHEKFVIDLRSRVFAQTESQLDKRGLLSPRSVRPWLRARQSEQESVTFLQVEQTFSSGKPGNIRPAISLRSKRTLELEVVVWERRGLEIDLLNSTKVSVDYRGPLGLVKAAADALHRRFGWTESSAAGWFLSGSAPSVRGISVSAEFDRRWTKPDGSLWWKRLSFDVPADIPITALTKWGELQGKRESAHRGKPIGDRQLELAIFSAVENDKHSSWNDVLAKWNSIAPRKWCYTGSDARRHLAKDARETYAKLTGERLVWKRSRTDAET